MKKIKYMLLGGLGLAATLLPSCVELPEPEKEKVSPPAVVQTVENNQADLEDTIAQEKIALEKLKQARLAEQARVNDLYQNQLPGAVKAVSKALPGLKTKFSEKGDKGFVTGSLDTTVNGYKVKVTLESESHYESTLMTNNLVAKVEKDGVVLEFDLGTQHGGGSTLKDFNGIVVTVTENGRVVLAKNYDREGLNEGTERNVEHRTVTYDDPTPLDCPEESERVITHLGYGGESLSGFACITDSELTQAEQGLVDLESQTDRILSEAGQTIVENSPY